MKKLLITGLLACIAVLSISQTTKDSCNLKVCVINKSLYQIEKIIINQTLTIDSLAPNERSDFNCLKSLYKSFRYEITFSKKKLFGGISRTRIISQPIDHVGEREIKEGKVELYITIEKVKKNKHEIHFDFKTLVEGSQTE